MQNSEETPKNPTFYNGIQSLADFHILPKEIIESQKSSEGEYHSTTGPAIITENAVYFLKYGQDWDDETYTTYIEEKIQELIPGININDYVFSQLESLVLTLKGWGQRKKLPSFSYTEYMFTAYDMHMELENK